MPRNGSGSYSLPQLPFTPGTTISSTAVNSDLSDIATAITGSIAADGQTSITGPLKASTGTQSLPSYSFSAETNSGWFYKATGQIGLSILGILIGYFDSTGFKNSNGIGISPPVGSLLEFAGSSAPSGYLLCYGQAISRVTYAALFAVIGTAFGVGDGSSTFNVPDFRGRVGAGRDDMGGVAANRLTSTYFGSDPTIIGDAGGSQSHTLTTPEIPSHTHAVTDPGHNHTFTFSAVANPGSGTPAPNSFVPPGNLSTSTNNTGITIGNTGGGTAHSIVPPAIIINKIIFVGV